MSTEAKGCGCGPRDMCTACATSEELADGIMRFLAAEIRGDSGKEGASA